MGLIIGMVLPESFHEGYSRAINPRPYQPLAPTGVHDLGYQPGVLSTLRVAGFRAINPVSYQPGVLSRVASGAYQPGALSTRGPINPGAYQPMGQTEF